MGQRPRQQETNSHSAHGDHVWDSARPQSPPATAIMAAAKRRRPWYEDPDWRELRASVLRSDYDRCRKCGSQDELEVDHIVPIADGGDPWDSDNLQTLCRRCHRAKTGAEASGRAARRRAVRTYRAACELLPADYPEDRRRLRHHLAKQVSQQISEAHQEQEAKRKRAVARDQDRVAEQERERQAAREARAAAAAQVVAESPTRSRRRARWWSKRRSRRQASP
ncbi:MAG: HNH endonuclease [Acidimicrobiia bacterium]|nr:HNH endonuclease [Acidimicrobiia bacterium]MYB24790.1 HNH endonuclease [Acidimicrobiia bacterium]MYE66667.1 HNH endonuclease [Acidimicrobiia bacterium]MYJ14758.1 HNH endonuclease [Acidimicrobiia bacterium]